ncbi:MAG: hypothetical protein ACPLXC_00625 [Candidatus Pacearchaeota archaeon]
MKNQITKKISALFLSILVVSMTITFSFSMNTPTAKAVEWGCCLKYQNKYCTDDVTRDVCEGMFFTGKACTSVPECKEVLCRPDNLRDLPLNEVMVTQCQVNKHQYACRDENKGAVANEEVCALGCCMIPGQKIGRVCQTLPKFVCQELARRDGGNYTFEAGLTSNECYSKCAADKLGCCVLGGGDCKYGSRGECSSETFYEGMFCYEVGPPQCVTEHNASLGCCSSAVVGGGEIKRAICMFDSQGNQEETISECPYPETKCDICNKDTCYDHKNNTVSLGQPYCKDRSCYPAKEGAIGSQKIVYDNTTGKPKIEFVPAPEKMLHGSSVCYNFYTYYQSPSQLNLDSKSTGLQNQILRCVEGNIEIQGLGADRETLCLQTSTVTTAAFDNNWEQCRTCANKSGFWNTIGDAFLAVPKGGWKFIFPLQFSAPYCKAIDEENPGQSCNSLGEVKVADTTQQMCWFNQDTSFPTKIGSCDPLYPPGTSTQCAECGQGYDSIYNVCDAEECAALGNCQTKGLGLIGGTWSFLKIFIPAFLATRMSVVPSLDCMSEAAWKCFGPHFPACFPGAYAACLVDRTKYVNPLCLLSGIIGSAISGTDSDTQGKIISTISLITTFIPGLPAYVRFITAGIGIWGAAKGGGGQQGAQAVAGDNPNK